MNPFGWLTRGLTAMLSDPGRRGKPWTFAKISGRADWWTLGPNGERLNPQSFSNGLCTVGINKALEVMFRLDTQLAAFYVGLIDDTSFSAVSSADTMSSHGGWIEFTGFSGANRPAWGPIAAAAGSMTNTTAFSYTLTSDATLRGVFVTSGQAKSGTSGTIWATALQTRSVTNGDTLQGTYTTTITPSS